MKIYFLLFILIILSCTQPIINEYYTQDKVKEFVNIQVYPNQSITKSGSPNTATQDWNQGVLYKENTKSFDTLIHEIDLSSITGNKQALVYLEAAVISHGMNNITGLPDNEAGQIYIRGKGSLSTWQSITPKYQQNTEAVLVLTDTTGKIEWYHEHAWEYWDNPTCDPRFEIYKWEKIIITAKWLVVGITI